LLYILLCGLSVFSGECTLCLADEPLANDNLSGLYVRSIEQVLRLKPDQIDIGIAALIVSEAWSDMVAGRRYQQELDDMAIEIRSRLKTDKPGANAIPVINAYLFDELKFKAIDKADDPEDLFLHSVMDRRRGYCLSLSILYLAIGERLGLPLYGVVVPGHFFVRYDDGRLRFNIETTSKGGTAKDDYYIKKFNVPRNGDTLYMVDLNKLQTLGCFFNNLGNVYNDVANYDQAMAALQCAVQINPMLAESRMNLGNIYLMKDRVDDAIVEYQQALKINPDDAKIHNNLGNAYQKRGWLGDALAEHTAAVRLDPKFVDAYRNLAATYRKLNNPAKAKTALLQAIELEPKNALLYCELADVYSQFDDCGEAIPRYEKALALDLDLAEAYFGKGVCFGKLGQTGEEINAYRKALAINPNMLAALANLGNAYFAKGSYKEAIEKYQRAIQISPDDAKLYYNLGISYSGRGEYEKAVKAILKAVGLDPEMADAHYALAFAYYKMKDYNSAAKYIKMAEQLGTKIDPDLLKAIEHRN